MATFPVFPIVTDDDLDYVSDEYSSDGDILAPTLDLGESSDEIEEFEGDGDDEDEDTADNLFANNDLAFLLNPRKIGDLFPVTAGQRSPAQGIMPFPGQTPKPIVPKPTAQTTFPTQVPKPTVPTQFPKPTVPTPMTLRLAVMPVQAPVPPVATKPITGIPQLTGMINAPQAPQTIKLNPTPTVTPLVPQLTGLAITPTKVPAINVLPGKPVLTTAETEAIITKMPGINVSGITPATAQMSADIENLIQKEEDESPEDFEARRRLTLKLASIPDYKLNNSTAVVAGHLMMKKSKLGVTYDPDVEGAVTYLASLLQR